MGLLMNLSTFLRRLMPGMASAAVCPLILIAAMLLPRPAAAQVQVYMVAPSAMDPALAGSTAPHRVYFDPEAARRNELLLFLPGTGGVNAGAPRPFSVIAAELGYHVIELAYPDAVSATICWRNSDPSCFENFRREIIEGIDASPLISIARGDSIDNRLEKLLRLLDAKQPRRNWGQFLNPAGAIAWRKVAVAGQSQGGGHAALIARDHETARVLLFASPKDYDPWRHKPATWYRRGRTPLERFFAFDDVYDRQGCTFPEQIENYRAMGMVDTPVNVEDEAPPYENSHILITSYPGRAIPSMRAHVMGISNPRFKQVWVYMLTHR
jgi:hypothetical protein